ncbi:hypothetical protein F5884DRAFT_746475 [Xylogone sp. PMI_703]|nr:hypothetical protein F5884DRAFT_746475 [Xylogone sp. PMI_703]
MSNWQLYDNSYGEAVAQIDPQLLVQITSSQPGFFLPVPEYGMISQYEDYNQQIAAGYAESSASYDSFDAQSPISSVSTPKASPRQGPGRPRLNGALEIDLTSLSDPKQASKIKRQKQNREAQRNFRQRRKETLDKISAELELERQQKALLEEENRKLQQELQSMKGLVVAASHVCVNMHGGVDWLSAINPAPQA